VNRNTVPLLLAISGICIPPAFGYTSDGSAPVRSFNRSVASTNSTVVVTVSFTNSQSTPLRGFFYAEQMPSALAVIPVSVSLNGQAITDYTFESGLDGDVYVGCTPYRWVLEQPTNFFQANPIPPMGWVQITYSVASSLTNTTSLSQFTWADLAQASTNAAFGCSESSDSRSISFIASPPPHTLSTQLATNGWRLRLDALDGASFAIQASTNLTAWDTLTTNVAPFTFIDVEVPVLPQRFYRGFWVP
jgi:hypothetical protein